MAAVGGGTRCSTHSHHCFHSAHLLFVSLRVPPETAAVVLVGPLEPGSRVAVLVAALVGLLTALVAMVRLLRLVGPALVHTLLVLVAVLGWRRGPPLGPW